MYIGLLSKSRGHVLRLAGVLHILFRVGADESPTNAISDKAVKAAINFVEVSCQQTAYIAGRGIIDGEIERFKCGKYCCVEFEGHV